MGTPNLTPSQQAITGEEYIGDQTQPIQALSLFYRAFNQRDLALMEQDWEQSDEAEMDNPLGGIKRGWAEIRPVYEKIFEGGSKVNVEFYDYTFHLNGNIFYAVGRERGRLESDGVSLDLAIRTSRILRRGHDGIWRQVHHHGSIDDPQSLAEYQAAVIGRKQASGVEAA